MRTLIPCYPRALSFGTVVGNRSPEGRHTWQRYWANAVDVPSPATEALGKAARQNGVYLAVGVIERDTNFGGGILYCTMLYFGPDGQLLGKHRKLKPTAAEHMIWGEGDGSTLIVIDTEYGKLGGLICWENYMPMARMAMYGKGVEIHLAPTADARDSWQATLRHIACEGRCFVLGCNQYVTKSMCPADLEGIAAAAPSSRRWEMYWLGLCTMKKVFFTLISIWRKWRECPATMRQRISSCRLTREASSTSMWWDTTPDQMCFDWLSMRSQCRQWSIFTDKINTAGRSKYCPNLW